MKRREKLTVCNFKARLKFPPLRCQYAPARNPNDIVKQMKISTSSTFVRNEQTKNINDITAMMTRKKA